MHFHRNFFLVVFCFLQTLLLGTDNPNRPIVVIDDVGNGTAVWELDTGTTRVIQTAIQPAAGSPYVVIPAPISDPTKYSFGLQYGTGANAQGTAAWISTDMGTGLSSLYAISRFLNGPSYWQPAPVLISAVTDNVLPDFQVKYNINFGNCIFTWRCVEGGQVKVKGRTAGWPMDVLNMSAITTLSP